MKKEKRISQQPSVRTRQGHRCRIAISATLLWCAASSYGEGERHQTTSQRPNIVIILADDVGFSDIGCYGSEIATPQLDALATKGLRFTQFYNTARCCPTRASLLTGLYPHQAGMGHMTADSSPRISPGYTGDLSRSCSTIAEVLKRVGYATYMTGKWHVTSHTAPNSPLHNWPLQRGFDRFYGTIEGGGSFYDPTTLCRGNTYITPENDPEYRPDSFYYTDAIADNAVAYLKEHFHDAKEKPFFLYASFTAAHWPMHALPEDIAKYEGKYDVGYGPIRAVRFKRLQDSGIISPECEMSPQVGDWSEIRNKHWESRCMEVYAAMIDRMDQKIGDIVSEIEEAGELDRTLILFLQDNGGCAERMGRGNPERDYPTDLQPMGPDELQTEIWPPMQTRDGRPVRSGRGVMPGPADTYVGYGRNWASVSNTPFREYKHWVHEGGIATPLIVHWPNGVDAEQENSLVHEPSHLIDIMATCIDVSGADYRAAGNETADKSLMGVSLRPLFSGAAVDRGRPLFWEHEGNCAIRDGRWKLVRYGNSEGRSSSGWELYDMRTDRTEMHDLSASHPKKVDELAAKWNEWAERSAVLPWPWNPDQAKSSEQTRFSLDAGDRLTRNQSPHVAGKAFTVQAILAGPAQNGVLVAQGGAANGWALYIRDGIPTFSLRTAGRLITIGASEQLSSEARQITALVIPENRVVLSVDDREVGSGLLTEGLERMPVDGLQVGRDAAGQVASYGADNAYRGPIEQIVIEIDPAQ